MNAFTTVKLLLQLWYTCSFIYFSKAFKNYWGGGSPPPPLVSTTDRNQIGMIE